MKYTTFRYDTVEVKNGLKIRPRIEILSRGPLFLSTALKM